jgi:uracil-DNA glycosylase
MSHTPLPPFSAYSGSRSPRMLLVGEAWGQSEEELRKPFVGESGKELWLMLGEAMPHLAPELHAEASAMHRYGLAWVKKREAWLDAAGIGFTNVLALRPPGNKLDALCASKSELPDGGKTYTLPAIIKGKYLLPEFLPELARLWEEIDATRPNLVVALGNTACWGLLGATNIGSIRGTVTRSYRRTGEVQTDGPKTIATYHPAAIIRQWSWRPIVVVDLMKADREAAFAEIRRPARSVIVNPTLAQAESWTRSTIASPPPLMACDIETAFGQITCIGFARARDDAIVIPFVDSARPGANYWPDASAESQAWQLVRGLLESPIPKVFQNGLYDLQYILRMGIRPEGLQEDTMLLHHSWFPEMQKGLGFLGSIFTSESSWKLMRRTRQDSEKRDE